MLTMSSGRYTKPLLPSSRTVPSPGYEAPGYRFPVAPPTESTVFVLVIASLKLYSWVSAAFVTSLAKISETAQRLPKINSEHPGETFFIRVSFVVEYWICGPRLAESPGGVLAHEKAP